MKSDIFEFVFESSFNSCKLIRIAIEDEAICGKKWNQQNLRFGTKFQFNADVFETRTKIKNEIFDHRTWCFLDSTNWF